MKNLQQKNQLIELIDQLPEEQFVAAKAFIEFLIAQSKGNADYAIIKAFEEAPEEDEELSEEMLKEIEEAEEDVGEGKTVSWEQVKKELEL